VLISGDNNTVQSSQVLGNVIDGIRLFGANNTVKGNTVNENRRAGITAISFATASTIVSNTALRNAIELEDENPNCDANVWRHNNFNTANQPQCID
jgi:parallel beta-helix repeat protein